MTMTVAEMRRATSARLRRPESWHILSLALAAVVLVVLARRQWFFFDEWSFLVPSLEDNLLNPHVGHWSLTPILLTRALRGIFGLTTYWPYILLSIAVHLVLCHLLWRVMRRIGVNGWIAAALALLLALLGAGAENILWAFQVGFMGAIALGIAVILLVDGPRLTPARWVATVFLSMWSVTFSGTAIAVLVAAGLVALARHGFLKAAFLLGPSGVLYLGWYLAFRSEMGVSNGPASLGAAGIEVPEYVGHVFVDGLDKVLPVVGAGSIAVFCLLLWIALTSNRWRGPAVIAYALVIAAVLQATLTAFSRSSLGVEAASSGRYIYAVVAVLLPAIGMAFTWFARERAGVVAVLTVLTMLIAGYNLALLVRASGLQATVEHASQQRIFAALDIVSEPGADYPSGIRPEPVHAPDVTVADLLALEEAGWLTVGQYDLAASLTVRSTLDVDISPSSDGPDVAECDVLDPGTSETYAPDGPVLLRSESSSPASLALRDDDILGDPRVFTIATGWTEVEIPDDLEVVFSLAAGATGSVAVCTESTP